MGECQRAGTGKNIGLIEISPCYYFALKFLTKEFFSVKLLTYIKRNCVFVITKLFKKSKTVGLIFTIENLLLSSPLFSLIKPKSTPL
jgi:hypothetical protein